MRSVILLTLLLLIHENLIGNKRDDSFASPLLIGVNTGFGFQNGLGVDYHYRVFFFKAYTQHTILKRDNWSLCLVPAPQVNSVVYVYNEDDPSERTGYEAGINFGLNVTWNLIPRSMDYFLSAGTGPHYISGAPYRQRPGFIFSDQVTTGIDYRVADRIFLRIFAGIRHLSNAGMKRPNGGLNTLVFHTGFHYRLD